MATSRQSTFMPGLRLQLLGRPQLVLDGEPLRVTCGRKVFELLAFVATGTRGRREREEIASVLWPDLDPPDARAALRRHLHHLNRALDGSEHRVLRSNGASLALADELDVDVRDAAVPEFSANGTGDGPGEFLAGYDADWIAAVRAGLRERIAAELKGEIDSAQSTGDLEQALLIARRLERFDPDSEEHTLLVADLLARLRDRLTRAHTAPLHGFPAHGTTFVGREAEVAELLATIDARPLTSCVGPPGVGKTRLACHVASEFARTGGVPAFFVDLAHCRDAEQITDALVTVARCEFATNTLSNGPLERLGQSGALVLFDNAERVAKPLGDVVRRLLAGGPRLHIVVTSRVPLHVEGEALCQLAPLGLDDAVELFVDRAQLVRPKTPGMARSTSTVRTLCERVDGIPLAIELVAAQLRTLTLLQLASAPVRHSGTLRATFDASLELLDEETRRLFRHVAIFRGSFTAEDAAAIVPVGLDRTEDQLATLVDHSLLILESAESPAARYFMLAPLREYASSLLQAAGEDATLRERHARLYASRYVERTKQLNTDGAERFAGEIDREHENIAAALETLVSGGADVELGAQLCLAMQHLWFVTGRVVEGARWVAACLRQTSIERELRIRLLFMRALMARHQTDYGIAIDGYREVIALRRAEQNEEKVASALLHLSGCLSAVGDVAGAMDAAREAEQFFTRHPDPYYCGYVGATLGLAALRAGDAEMAEAEFRKSLRHFQAANLELDVASSLSNIGACRLARGDLDGAAELSYEAIERAQKIPAAFIAAASQITIAIVACESGDGSTARRHARQALDVAIATNDYERLAEVLELGARIALSDELNEACARLFGAAEGVRERCHAVRVPIDEAAINSLMARCRERLGPARFDALRLGGESLRTGDSIATLRSALAGS